MTILDTRTVTVAEVIGITEPPPAPALLSPANGATDVSTSPTLVWNPEAVATSYHVQLATDSDFAELVIDQANITESSLGVSELTLGEEYFWRVIASNSYGDSPWSDIWSFAVSVEEEEDVMGPLLAMAVMVMMIGIVAPTVKEGD